MIDFIEIVVLGLLGGALLTPIIWRVTNILTGADEDSNGK